MKKLEIFEPAMCCPTGVCGTSVEPELLRITSLVGSLKDNEEVKAYRYNLTSNPKIFVTNETVLHLLQENGQDILPITLVNGKLVKTGTYPTMADLQDHCQIIFDRTGEMCCGGKEGCCISDVEIEEQVQAQMSRNK